MTLQTSILSLIWLVVFGCSVGQQTLTNSDRIVFLGDSITELGMKPSGYVTLIEDSLQQKFGSKTPEIIGAGVSGNKVPDLQGRLERDVLSKKPTIVIVYIGINDVWHFVTPGRTGTPRDDYQNGLEDIIARIQGIGARVILCTPSVIGEKFDGTNPQDKMLDDYSEISRNVAKKTGSVVCDLRKDFVGYLRTHNPENKEKEVLTVDGVHLNDQGNRFVASEILKTLTQ